MQFFSSSHSVLCCLAKLIFLNRAIIKTNYFTFSRNFSPAFQRGPPNLVHCVDSAQPAHSLSCNQPPFTKGRKIAMKTCLLRTERKTSLRKITAWNRRNRKKPATRGPYSAWNRCQNANWLKTLEYLCFQNTQKIKTARRCCAANISNQTGWMFRFLLARDSHICCGLAASAGNTAYQWKGIGSVRGALSNGWIQR